MIGILAYEALRYQDFEARLCLAPFEVLRDPSQKTRLIQRGSVEAQLLHPNLWPIQNTNLVGANAESPTDCTDTSDVIT